MTDILDENEFVEFLEMFGIEVVPLSSPVTEYDLTEEEPSLEDQRIAEDMMHGWRYEDMISKEEEIVDWHIHQDELEEEALENGEDPDTIMGHNVIRFPMSIVLANNWERYRRGVLMVPDCEVVNLEDYR